MHTSVLIYIALFILGVVFASKVKLVLEIIYGLTIGPWVIVFGASYSTGNGAGAMGMLVAIAVIIVQLAIIALSIIGGVVWYILK